MFLVVTVMASLAHRFQIVIRAVLRLMIQMRYRQADQPTRPLCDFSMPFHAPAWSRRIAMQAALTVTFALTTRTRTYTRA